MEIFYSDDKLVTYFEVAVQADFHSGDSVTIFPPEQSKNPSLKLFLWTVKLVKRRSVCRHKTCQCAITVSGDVSCSRLTPTHHKQFLVYPRIMHLLVKCSSLLMSGKSFYDPNFTKEVLLRHALFPFS